MVEDGESRSIFNAPAGIKRFQFGKQVEGRIVESLRQSHERRVPDG
jgi:hypothetical protein